MGGTMKALFTLVLGACLALVACDGKDATKPNADFSDELTLGTGMAGFNLVGETTSFHGTPCTLCFRLESSEDLQGSPIEIRVEQATGENYTSFQTFTFPSLQSYGHIYLSSFGLVSTGQFRAKGVKVTSGRVIAMREFRID